MKRGGAALSLSTSAATMPSLAASWRAIASALSPASWNILVSFGFSMGVTSLSFGCDMVAGIRFDGYAKPLLAVQFGDEIVGVAAIQRGGELDHVPVVEKRSALDRQRRAAGIAIEQFRIVATERDRAQALQRARRPATDLLERIVERQLDRIRVGNDRGRHDRRFDRERFLVGEAQAAQTDH